MSVFRELFVEVPMALLEAAVAKAQPSVTVPIRFDVEYAVRVFSKQTGLDLIDSWRSADRDEIVVRVRLKCRHVGRITIDETVLVRLGRVEICEYLYYKLASPPSRKCYCVEYVPSPPCNAGVCK